MSKSVEVVALVEGPTEKIFVKALLSPYLARAGVYMTSTILTKPGQNGGDVRFSRAQNDIGRHLKQRKETWLTLLIDYCGIKSDWPGYQESKRNTQHMSKARVMNEATRKRVNELFGDQDSERRFIPYVSMFEFEALLFSDAEILAQKLNVRLRDVEKILSRCGEPEKINDKSQTAPSKRLAVLSDRFKKTVTGINIAREIGIDKMRGSCPIFNEWITKLENLKH
ncbi:MAG: DUF4276 family protein [Nitrospira sp. SB0675_bin_23]|nr:DUF4276 family protein [Nitrospira sp. SB0675_bin_23]